MDPNSGRVVSDMELARLQEVDPAEAAKYSVRLEGSAEDIEKVSSAVRAQFDAKQREANRRKNKAARKARRSGR